MSFISNIFNKEQQQGSSKHIQQEKKKKIENQSSVMLPKGFAESILFNDISLVLSDYSNREALNKLIQLYMKGVELFESINDYKQEYFKIKLQWLMNHPKLQEQKSQKESVTPQDQTKLNKPQNTSTIELKTSKVRFFKPDFQVDQSQVHHFEPQENIIQAKTRILLSDQIKMDIQQKETCEETKRDSVSKSFKNEIVAQDQQKEAKQLVENLKKEKIVMNSIIQGDIDSQTLHINARLRQRKQSVHRLDRSSSLPKLSLDFNSKLQEQSQVQETNQVQEQNQFQEIAPVKQEAQRKSHRQNRSTVQFIVDEEQLEYQD